MLKALLVVCFISIFLAMNSLADIEVLVLAGNRSQAEFPALEAFDSVGAQKVSYDQTSDRSLPGLNDADVFWIGQGEICENAYFFDADAENKIKNFVQSGGVVIAIGQDSDDNRPCEAGWLPVPIEGVERGGQETFKETGAKEAGDLFTKPNTVAGAHFDDTWLEPDDPYIMLATIGPNDIGIALLKHGRGYYIVTGIENEDAGDVATNSPLMENLIHYAVKLSQSVAVEGRGKLTANWGAIKSAH